MHRLSLFLFALMTTLCTPAIQAQTLETYANRAAIPLLSTNQAQVSTHYVRTVRIAAVTVVYATPYSGSFTFSTLTGSSRVEVPRCSTSITNVSTPGYSAVVLAPSAPAYLAPGEPIYISASTNMSATVYVDFVYQ